MTDVAQHYTAPTIPGPVPGTNKPKLKLPPGSCDCHAHFFGPQAKYPLAADRRYTPHDGPLENYLGMLRVLGVERAVLVQPSVYMTDNSAILDALANSDFPLRGIAVVNDDVADKELERMHELGIRGLRVNLKNKNGAAGDSAPRMAKRIAPLGWHLQFRIDPEDFDATQRMLDALAVDFVIDHMGQAPAEEGLSGPTFRNILKVVKSGRCWVKLSGPMRMGKEEFPYPDVVPFARALVDAAPDRMIWATDWPHTTITKKMQNDGDLCDLLAEWVPDAATRKKVLVDNPAKLFGF